MATPNAAYPGSSDTNSTPSGPTGNGPDNGFKAKGNAGPDTGMAPPVAPKAASNADMVNPHMTMCSGDAVLCKTIANGVAMHDTGAVVMK